MQYLTVKQPTSLAVQPFLLPFYRFPKQQPRLVATASLIAEKRDKSWFLAESNMEAAKSQVLK